MKKKRRIFEDKGILLCHLYSENICIFKKSLKYNDIDNDNDKWRGQ